MPNPLTFPPFDRMFYKPYQKTLGKQFWSILGRIASFDYGGEELIKVGVKAIIQPGGSINDKKVIETANKAGIVMVFTGTRHFKH